MRCGRHRSRATWSSASARATSPSGQPAWPTRIAARGRPKAGRFSHGWPSRRRRGREARRAFAAKLKAGKLTLAPLVWSGSSPAARPTGCSSRPTWTTCRLSSPARPFRPGHGAGARLEPDRARRRGAGRGGAARQGLFTGRAGRRPCAACGGGASGILVSSTARDAGIAGLEFLRGIPGTVGGFVRMNGGAYGREVADILSIATWCCADGSWSRCRRAT
jgi:hypothetical protein